MRYFFVLSLAFLASVAAAQSVSDVVRQRLIAQGNVEYANNSLTLLPSARIKYEALFQSIREARRYVHLEYFSVHNDSVGNALLRLLREKAAEGVEVRLLIDDYGNRKTKRPWTKLHLDSLNAWGVRTVLFDPFRFPWINHAYHRDHRKIVVVDGVKAFTGGMNVADYYILGTPRSGPWRDMHVCLEGPVVGAYERIFAHIWEKETAEKLDSLRYQGGGTSGGDKIVTVVNREPAGLSRRMREAYTASIDAARHEIRIVNPYPTNVRMIRAALKRAVKRGVRVMIMVSASSDVKLTPDVIAIEMKKQMGRGCEVYYFKGGFHHSKLMMVDGEFCTIGTANLDGRSMLYDYEVNAFVFDTEVTAQLNAIFDVDLQNSELLTRENFKERFSLKQRVTGRVFQPLRSLF